MSKDKNSGPSADFFEFPTKTGWLTKLGGTGLKANWRRRYVVLDHHYLFYFKTDKDRSPAGIICLPEYDIVAKADYKECRKQNSFVITSSCNLVATTQSDQRRPYYMFADSEQECQEWVTAVEAEMVAMVDPCQKPFFTASETKLHTTMKNGFQDVIVGNFDDVTRSGDGPRLEHITANRPKKPHTRAPSRGAKDFVTFDEDDVSSFSFSPISELEEKKIEKRVVPKKPSTNLKPMKPPSDTLGSLPERPVITKPKPAMKPNILKSTSLTETVTSPVKTEIQTLPAVEQTETETLEFIPKPTPRRKAPTVPEVPKDSKTLLPTLPSHPRSLTQAPPPSEPIQLPRQTDSPDTSPARRHAPSAPSLPREEHPLPSIIKHPPSQLETSVHGGIGMKQSPSLPSSIKHSPSQPETFTYSTSVPILPSSIKHSPSQPETFTHSISLSKEERSLPFTFKHSPSLPETSAHEGTDRKQSPSLPEAVSLRGTPSPPEPVSDTRSYSPSPTRDTIVPPEAATYVEPYFSTLTQAMDSSGDSSESENLYQIPRIDPIYQIPSGLPVLFQRTETGTDSKPDKFPLQKLHSVGHSITPSPKPSTEGPNYTDLVTGYYCSSPSNTPFAPPIPSHKRLSGHLKTRSLPREYFLHSNPNLKERKSSSSSSNSSRPNSSLQLDPDYSDRMLSQIRDLEEQLLALTSSPRRHSLSPAPSQSNSVSHILQIDGQRLIDHLRSVVWEALNFHKQSAELLQTARTEKRIAEKERKDAELNSENLSNIIAKFQQSS